jgi:putative transposase
MHRGIACELEGTPYEQRQASLDTWRKEFNGERPHEALAMRFPAEVYQPSSRSWKGSPEKIEYPGACSRRVNPRGVVCFEGEHIFLSTALAGWDVGLKPRNDNSLDVYFSRLLLGRLEPQTAAFIPVTASDSAADPA